jgi:hypothetical protein
MTFDCRPDHRRLQYYLVYQITQNILILIGKIKYVYE